MAVVTKFAFVSSVVTGRDFTLSYTTIKSTAEDPNRPYWWPRYYSAGRTQLMGYASRPPCPKMVHRVGIAPTWLKERQGYGLAHIFSGLAVESWVQRLESRQRRQAYEACLNLILTAVKVVESASNALAKACVRGRCLTCRA